MESMMVLNKQDFEDVVTKLMAENQPDKILNLQDAATFMKCSTRKLTVMVENNVIPGRRFGEQWRFSQNMLIEWVKKSEREAEDEKKA